jgi:exosortase
VATGLVYDGVLQTQTASIPTHGEFGANEPKRLSFFLVALALLPLWFVCCRFLGAEWSFNEQYNYGWFVPFFAAYLFWERWRDRPAPSDSVHKIFATLLIVAAGGLLLPLRVFEIGTGDWRPLGWLHVAAIATITLSIIYLSGGKPWLRHFSFPVLFFFIAVPWITPIETPIVQGFMRIIAAISAETLALLGVPVQVEGNLLRLPTGVVGVSEACSGVRSFQTSLMIGLFFGEVKRLRVWPRLILIASAVGIGLFANFLRASLLVWIASRSGLAAVGRWHDIFGYAIVVLVFAGTMWIASLWQSSRDTESSPVGHQSPARMLPRSLLLAVFIWAVAVEIAAESWYRVHEQNLVARPSWSVRWPENASAYHEIKVDSQVRNLLRFNSGREVTWTSGGDGVKSAPSMFNYLFFFRWNPGNGTILRARAHRPDICLPAAGWRQVGEGRLANYSVQENFSLPFRRFDFVKETSTGLALHAAAFFTLHEDVSHESERATDDNAGFYSNWDWADRWRVVRNGIRNRGQQVFELIMVESENNKATVEQEFASTLPKLIEPDSAAK